MTDLGTDISAPAPSCRILQGDALSRARELPDASIHCIVTSPPYWALRDYEGPAIDFAAGSYSPMPGLPPAEYPAWHGQLGLEPEPVMFIGHLVEIFRELRRVLRKDGTCWVNMGDSYAGGGRGGNPTEVGSGLQGGQDSQRASMVGRSMQSPAGLKPKDLVGQPWRIAFALQADGWYLRQDIIWHKPNPMPESVRDRCTKAHEYLFLLTKSPKYSFDAGAIKEPVSGSSHPRGAGVHPKAFGPNSRVSVDRDPYHQTESRIRAKSNRSFSAAVRGLVDKRNKRDVWSISPRAYKRAHFATFPSQLVEPCVLAGCPRGGVVLDPFGGSGTVAGVALQHGRDAVLIELNRGYVPLIEARLAKL